MNQSLTFVIFGATGDLAHRKLVPALFDLFRHSEIGENVSILAVGRRDITSASLREDYADSIRLKKDFDTWAWREFAKKIRYVKGVFEDPALYQKIADELSMSDGSGCALKFYYLATPPVNYATILHHLNASGLSRGCGNDGPQSTRVLIEKPFGSDLATAQFLDRLLSDIFDENQIYRIDHYLGKETVQNILAFRFANGIFEPTWNREFVDHIQITLSEDIGIGKRGAFYDTVGALRDMVQNHILEMLALIAMEKPTSFASEAIRDERVRIFEHIIPFSDKEVTSRSVRGQYQGYVEESGVQGGSNTETFVALKLELNMPRWIGVPFYIRTGKKLSGRDTEISIHYRKPPCAADVCFFPPDKVKRNILALRIQPKDGIALRLMIKEPGFGMKIAPTIMRFDYGSSFSESYHPDAYERLLIDAIGGDQTLFSRTDGILASWKFITTILTSWQKNQVPVHLYEPGTMGPKEADDLINADEREWFLHRD